MNDWGDDLTPLGHLDIPPLLPVYEVVRLCRPLHWKQLGFLLLQHVSAVYERHKEGHTELTEEITDILNFSIPSMKR